MRRALISLSLLLAGGAAMAQQDAMKPRAPQTTDAARPPAVMPAKPLTPQGPLAAPANRKPSVATGDNDDSVDLDVQRRTVRGAAAPGATNAKRAASTTRSKATHGGADSGPSGQTEDEVYIGARSKARPMKQ